jgi:hypothetical protein
VHRKLRSIDGRGGRAVSPTSTGWQLPVSVWTRSLHTVLSGGGEPSSSTTGIDIVYRCDSNLVGLSHDWSASTSSNSGGKTRHRIAASGSELGRLLTAELYRWLAGLSVGRYPECLHRERGRMARARNAPPHRKLGALTRAALMRDAIPALLPAVPAVIPAVECRQLPASSSGKNGRSRSPSRV